ncbi:hypothetical protein HMPREF1987_01109 [Peptostreptococcaceae bacterium oral taxon 113 str. W5053]|nr:hypothetical protein HMPREF1987_01109 [Peptostreptococcaceae bacterium oral taxon 113 str. W5053]
MRITKGKVDKAQRIVIYGPEGIGKTTFASKFPQPLFVDTEGSTSQFDVARMDTPSSWTMLLEQIKYVISHPEVCKTLIIDTIDWAERLCVESVCAKHGKKGIEDFGYGNGYVYVAEEIGRFLNLLNDVIDKNIHVVLTAHAQIRKIEQPEEFGGYDHWELKLGKKTGSQTSPLVKEWADMLLFANYKVISVAVDDKGQKRKGTGGKRTLYTTHHVCWDAKNRHSLPDEVEFDFQSIAHCVQEFKEKQEEKIQEENKKENKTEEVQKERYFFNPKRNAFFTYTELNGKIDETMTEVTEEEYLLYAKQGSFLEEGKKKEEFNPLDPPIDEMNDMDFAVKNKALADLMKENQVSIEEIQNVVSKRGYYPRGTPIENYDDGFIAGVLVGAWPQVFEMIKKNR